MTARTHAPGETWVTFADAAQPLSLGASACLLGDPVRFDGGHARARFLTDELGPYVRFVRVCPEGEVGMGIPRPTLRLIDDADRAGPRLVAPRSGEDWTDRMHAFTAARLDALDVDALDGFVLKKDSPSCGLMRVKRYTTAGQPSGKDAQGLFAAALSARFPELPLEEEGRLNDPLLRANFLERIWCRNRWRVFLAHGPGRRALIEFHTAHKLLLRVHDESGYLALGQLVGSAGSISDDELIARYGVLFAQTLALLPTPGRHYNALQHVLGYLKDDLTSAEKQHILTQLEDYRAGSLPLLAPLATLGFLVERHGIDYIQGQLYLAPYPKQLAARRRL